MTIKDSIWEQIKEETADEFALLSPDDFFGPTEDCYYLSGTGIGSGEHCRMLAEDLFTTMLDQHYYPKYIVLMDRAVGFLRKGDTLLPVFNEMEQNGTAVCASRKSIELYGWEDEINPSFVEETSTILDVLRVADKVITL